VANALLTAVAAHVVADEGPGRHAVVASPALLHAARPGETETLCGLLVGEILAPTWPPQLGGCFRCHEVEQRELRQW
jgi:hypothetical protein